MRTDFSGEGTRTLDTADMSRMLYHLSYAAVIIFRRDYSGGWCICQSARPLPSAPGGVGGMRGGDGTARYLT